MQISHTRGNDSEEPNFFVVFDIFFQNNGDSKRRKSSRLKLLMKKKLQQFGLMEVQESSFSVTAELYDDRGPQTALDLGMDDVPERSVVS